MKIYKNRCHERLGNDMDKRTDMKCFGRGLIETWMLKLPNVKAQRNYPCRLYGVGLVQCVWSQRLDCFVRSVFRLLQQTMQPEGVKDMGTFYSSYGTTSRVFSRIPMSRLLVDNQRRLVLVGNLPTRMMSSVCAILETVCKGAELWGHNFPVWENRSWIGSKLILMQF